MNRQQKEQAVGELTHEFSEAEAVYAVDYRGLTVAQLSELRGRLLQQDTKLKVVKNSVTKLAADQAEVSTISEHLAGPTALAFVRGDAAAAAKTLQGFVKESDEILELKGGLLNGKALSSADVVAIAKLPSRETLVQQLVTLIAQPISGTARTLNAILAAVPVQLQKIADEGLIGGNAPAAEAPAAEAPAEAPETEAEAPADAAAEAAPADAADTDSTEE
jgi:large subunit ribosomal protein L10